MPTTNASVRETPVPAAHPLGYSSTAPDPKLSPEIISLVRSLCVRAARRAKFRDTGDLSSDVLLKLLLRPDVLSRARNARISLTSYLSAVVRNHLHDTLRSRAGVWRNSSRASSLGPLAMEYETLRSRDGLSIEDAFQTLRSEWGQRIDDDTVELLERSLPQRTSRSEVPLDCTQELASPAKEQGCLRDRQRASCAVKRGLRRALSNLPGDERDLIEQLYFRGRGVSELAREGGQRPGQLFARRDRILRRLRAHLEASGVEWSAVGTMLGQPGNPL